MEEGGDGMPVETREARVEGSDRADGIGREEICGNKRFHNSTSLQ